MAMVPNSLLPLCTVLVLTLGTSCANNDTESGGVVPSGGTSLDAGEDWGLPDGTAVVGRVFRYSLAANSLMEEANTAQYEMTAEDEKVLPAWLYSDSETRSIEGVASSELKDSLIYVQLTVLHANNPSKRTKEHFAIKVVDDNDHATVKTDANPPEKLPNKSPTKQHANTNVVCPAGSSITTATVIVDTDVTELSPRQRVTLLTLAANHLRLPVELLRLLPAGSLPLIDALVAGPGDVTAPQHPGALIQWVVGCGNVRASHMAVLERVEASAGNGDMARDIRVGVVGWHVTNNRPGRRAKRAFNWYPNPTPTLEPSLLQPTGRPVETTMVAWASSFDSGRPSSRPVLQPSTLPPQLEVSVTTRSAKVNPTRLTKSPTPAPTTRMTGYATRLPPPWGEDTIPWRGETTPGPRGPSTEWWEIEPSVEVKPSTGVSVTAALPAWTKYPSWSQRPSWSQGPSWSTSWAQSSSVNEEHWTTSTYPHWSGYPDETDVVWPTSRTQVWYTEGPDGLWTPVYETTSGVHPSDYSVEPSRVDRTSWVSSSTAIFGTTPPGGVLSSDSVSGIPDGQGRTTYDPRKTTDERRDSTQEYTDFVSKHTRKPSRTQRPTSGLPPQVKHPLEPINVEVGTLLWYKIPIGAFTDQADGSVEDFELISLTTSDQKTMPRTSWIKLNETSWILYGLPIELHAPHYKLIISARDRDGHIFQAPLNVTVGAPKDAEHRSHEFSVTLDQNYERFIYDVDTRLNVANKIARAFGDSDASKMTVTRILPGSVEFYWTNNTLPLDPCPVEAILALRKHLVLPDGSLNQSFVEAMRPYVVLKAGGTPLGVCSVDGASTPGGPLEADQTTATTPSPLDPAKAVVPSNNLFIYIIVGIVLIAVVLLVLIILCIAVYKRQQRRRAKQENSDKLSGLHKGIPIIFADELDDQEQGAGTPAGGGTDATPGSTLKSVRSNRDSDIIETVPPPEYPRSKPGSASSTLRSDWKKPLLSDDEDANGREDDVTVTSRKNAREREITESGTLPLR